MNSNTFKGTITDRTSQSATVALSEGIVVSEARIPERLRDFEKLSAGDEVIVVIFSDYSANILMRADGNHS